MPQDEEGSCREDDIDLYEYATEQGWSIAKNREEFDDFEMGKGKARLPLLGTFADGMLSPLPWHGVLFTDSHR